MSRKETSASGLELDRSGCTWPTGIGGLVGILVGGYLGLKDYQEATEQTVKEHGFADFLPVSIPIFAFLGTLIGLFVSILLMIGWRLLARHGCSAGSRSRVAKKR